LVSVLFTFYVQGVLKLKKNNSGAKGLILLQQYWAGKRKQLCAHSNVCRKSG